MALNIDAFVAELNRNDVQRSNLFKVDFPTRLGKQPTPEFASIPEPSPLQSARNFLVDNAQGVLDPLKKLSGVFSPDLIRAAGLGDVLDKFLGNPEASEIMGLFVRSVNLPGKSIELTENRSNVILKANPTTTTWSEMTMTFMMNTALDQRGFFFEWMDKMHDPRTGNVGFYDDYVANLRIKTYDRSGTIKSVTEIIEAYPISVGDISLSYESNNEVATFDVTFRFVRAQTGEIPKEPGNIFNEARDKFNTIRAISGQF